MIAESKKYELECLAPIHIGSGVRLKKYDYIYDGRGRVGTASFVSQGRLMRLLAAEGLVDAFASDLLHREVRDLGIWLREHHVPQARIKNIITRQAKAYVSQLDPKDKKTLNDLACMMTLADGRPYIPGSSIKGAMRTAILHHLLQQNQALKTKYWGEVTRAIGDRSANAGGLKKKLQRLALALENELLAQLDYRDAKGELSDAAMRSVMRGIVVGDASPARPISTVILAKTDATTKRGRDGKSQHAIPLVRECLPTGARLELQLSLDPSVTRIIGLDSIATLLEWCREYSQFGLELLDAAFGQRYSAALGEAREAHLLLGGGPGFISKTLFYSLAPSAAVGGRALAVLLDRYFIDRRKNGPAHEHVRLDTAITPRTLKLAQTDEEHWLIGLAALREVR